MHSGGEGRTGGGGPGGFGVHGGIGIFMPRFLSLGACCRLLLAMTVSFAGIRNTLREGAPDRFTSGGAEGAAGTCARPAGRDPRGQPPPPIRPMGLAKIQGFSLKKRLPKRAP